VRDLLTPGALLVIEWPERDATLSAHADLAIALRYQGEGRRADIEANSPAGRRWLDALGAAAATLTPAS
jgi:tRNA threonylcarbamoyladenosine biosynthesis protein TsaE